MKAILEFILPEEAEEHRTAIDAYKWRSVVDDMAGWLRTQDKHVELEKQATVAEIKKELLDLLEAEGLSL